MSKIKAKPNPKQKSADSNAVENRRGKREQAPNDEKKNGFLNDFLTYIMIFVFSIAMRKYFEWLIYIEEEEKKS